MNDEKTNWREADAPAVGRALHGFGVNLLVRDVEKTARFLREVLLFEILRQSADYAIARCARQIFQLHADHTYANNPLPSLLPENGARGAGIELRLFEVDPDAAEARAREGGWHVLQGSADKPHGLRECFILDDDGYCWVASRKLPAT